VIAPVDESLKWIVSGVLPRSGAAVVVLQVDDVDRLSSGVDSDGVVLRAAQQELSVEAGA